MSEYYLCIVLWIVFGFANATLWKLEVFHYYNSIWCVVATTVMLTCCWIISWQAMLTITIVCTVAAIWILMNFKKFIDKYMD